MSQGSSQILCVRLHPSPTSIYGEIFKLPGGCHLHLELTSRHHRVTRYWEFELEPEMPASPNAEAEWGEQIRELLGAAVSRRLVADVPVGIFLSGGFDSSAVAAMAVRERGRDVVHSFAIGSDDASFDESEAVCS